MVQNLPVPFKAKGFTFYTNFIMYIEGCTTAKRLNTAIQFIGFISFWGPCKLSEMNALRDISAFVIFGEIYRITHLLMIVCNSIAM